MYKKIHRFHGHGSIRWVLAKGTTVRGRLLSLRYEENQGGLKVAVVVSKKVAKSAVVRNRIRRRVYAIARDCLPPESARGGYVFLVYSPDVATMSASSLAAQIQKLVPTQNNR
ncbi:MAG: ribonuclease protein component [Patescibacteria group bacterium]|nr:ribonuclease protein component [Patescibacteria group bacterium]